MKKMVFMAAFVAACAAFVACSNENDLVQQKPDVPEETTVKYPMTLFVSTPETRGTDFNSTTNPLTSFKMYSNYHSTWNNGALFEKNDNGAWVNKYNAQMAWSDEDVDNKATYTFYGVNDFDNFSVVSAVTQKPTVLENTVSFGYTMPTNTRDTDDDGNPDESYVNYEDQVDLLVAKATAGPDVGTPKGALNVEFDHAMALIHNIYIYANPLNIPDGERELWKFRVNGIKLGGLKNAGVYTFGTTSANGTWDVSTGDDVVFDIPLDASELTFEKMSFSAGDKSTTAKKLPLKDDGLYLIPQVASGSAGATTASSIHTDWNFEVTGAYAEIEIQGATYEGDGYTYNLCYEEDYVNVSDYGWNEETSDANGFKKVRVPLKFTIAAGKSYNLYIDITKAIVYEETLNYNRNPGESAITGDSIIFDTSGN